MILPAIVYVLATELGHLSESSQTGSGGVLSVASMPVGQALFVVSKEGA